MKIGVLTLPLHTNYGGNLQAYALITALRQMGHEVVLINRRWNEIPTWKAPLVIGKRLVKRYFLSQKNVVVFLERERERNLEIIGIHTGKFIKQFIQPQTKPFYSTKSLSASIDDYNFDAIIVGSDQVWRPQYAPTIEDYFLGFLKDKKVRKIAYAASFGTDLWTFTPNQSNICSRLIKQFDAVSVREKSAVIVSEEKFGIKPVHVIDPTMLLTLNNYLQFIRNDNQEFGIQSKNRLLVYFLDENQDKKNVIGFISNKINLSELRVNSKTENKSAPIEERVAPPVENWIRGFYDSDYVVTDSFHACVFAILFHKPFVAYGNKDRGIARFQSLLEMFNLQNRLIFNSEELTDDFFQREIDWHKIDEVIEKERDKALYFLETALGGNS